MQIICTRDICLPWKANTMKKDLIRPVCAIICAQTATTTTTTTIVRGISFHGSATVNVLSPKIIFERGDKYQREGCAKTNKRRSLWRVARGRTTQVGHIGSARRTLMQLKQEASHPCTSHMNNILPRPAATKPSFEGRCGYNELP